VKIAEVVFAFKNGDLLKLCASRGTAIIKAQDQQVSELDEKIQAYI